MTTWNDTTTSETGWAAETAVSTDWDSGSALSTGWSGEDAITDPILTYENGLTYSVDYVTYDGRYIKDNIDWTAQQQLETAWRDEA